jgi:LysM repeat protein
MPSARVGHGDGMQRTALAAVAAAALLTPAAAAPAAVHTVAPGETLSGIAAANGLSTAALAAANGVSPTSFAIAGTTLQIPVAGVSAAPTAPAASGSGRLVAPGETLSGIAAANGLSTAELAAANGLSADSHVIAGTRLQVPAAGASAPAAGGSGPAAGGGHLVQPGETLSGIAAANGITPAALAAANGLTAQSFVISGTRLQIPAATAATAASGSGASASGAPAPMGGYTVQPGDTLSGLAARSRVSPAQIAYANGLEPDDFLVAGRVLKLPTGSPALASGGAPATAVPTPAAPGAAPQPTPARVTADQIAAIAAQHGVPGSLAAAIAWQESGFNNAMVSSASARGVMQVMPGTWDWVQTYLAGGRRLNPFSAEDNVHAGALYLGNLLRETGGDPALAAAGYYQGMASVRRIGMLPETRRYVDNVLALRSRFGG